MSLYDDYQKETAGGGGGFFTNNIINPIKNAFMGGVNEIKSGYQQAANAGKQIQSGGSIGEATSNLIGGASHMITGAGAAASSPTAPVIQRPLGAVSNAVSNSISDNPSVQKFAQSGAGQATAKVAGAVAQGANVVGTVGGAMEAGKLTGNIWDKVYNSPSKLDLATQARQTAGVQGEQQMQNMIGSVGDFKNDLGTSFKAGAAKIEQTNPNLKFTLSPAQVDALNTLKNNKSFALPDYIKQPALPEHPGQLGNGEIHLSPTQTQDLITQLNKSTFTEKASGLAVDQSKIGLTNEIKTGAKQAFGGDNSAWAKVYGDYAKGSNALNTIHDIVNLKQGATSSDIMKNINNIKSLSKTPEGQAVLQRTINEFKNVSGVDLSNPTQAIGQILEKDTQFQQAMKGGFMKQVFNPVYLGRLGLRMAAYGTIGFLFRKQITAAYKSITGQ